ncbi:regulator of Vps4 activity in the MVB pathway protein [Tasmannia lanceolata]|uniref:regulator of Vps4 activity in the MVB pathway protein n=1 Tax=Tasmannia lanceolata TaxID=3420 RepID=UPI004063D8CF
MSLLNSLFNRGLLGTKCKTCLSLAISRIKLLRNKREVQLKLMRKEIAQFLQTGQEPIARIRVEHVIREQNILAAYEILELFCEFVLARVPILETKRECPSELQEAIASIIFAAPRCSDLPELMQVQNLFTAKYGKEFISAASELRPDTNVNRAIIEKLSVKAPSGDLKLRILKEIAHEYSLEWDSSSTEVEFSKKHEDLLDGSNQIRSRAADLQTPIVERSVDVSLSKEGRSIVPTDQIQGIRHVQTLQAPITAKVAVSNNNNSLVCPDKTKQPDTNIQKDGPLGDQITQASSNSSDILERARAAIASAERASAAARAAAQLVNVRVGRPPENGNPCSVSNR